MAGVLSSRGCTTVIVVLIDLVECLDEAVFASKTHVNKYPRKGSLVLFRTFGIEFFVEEFCYFLEIVGFSSCSACGRQ
jgi:hypothetical protein